MCELYQVTVASIRSVQQSHATTVMPLGVLCIGTLQIQMHNIHSSESLKWDEVPDGHFILQISCLICVSMSRNITCVAS